MEVLLIGLPICQTKLQLMSSLMRVSMFGWVIFEGTCMQGLIKHYVHLIMHFGSLAGTKWQYDLPAMINLALNTSKATQLYYVGFSLGTTTAFAKLSQDPEFAKKIKKFYALAPMATVSHIKGPLAWIAPFTGAFETIFKLVGMDEFQPNQYLMDLFAKYFCGAPVADILCKNVLFLIGGPDSKQMNQTRLPVYLSHSPGGTSTRTMIHLGQMVKSGKFQAFDYGRKENKEHYHQDKPVEYDLNAVGTPIVIYSGGQDWLADPKDVSGLVGKLKTLVDNVYLAEYNDFDFIWGLRATAEVYFPIKKDIQKDIHASLIEIFNF